MPYIGPPAPDRFVAPKAAKQFSGDGSTTAFTLEHAVGSDEDILVSVDGVIQEPSVAYAVSNGTTLTFTAAPSSNSGNNIFVYYLFRTVGTVSHPSSNALEATSGTFTGNLIIPDAGNIGSASDTDAISINSSGVVTQSMKVPLAYGPKQKWLTRLDQDAGLDSKVALTLPRLGFEMVGLTYDSTRKLNRVQKFKKTRGGDDKNMMSQYQPVPYNIGFTLYAMAKNSDDALQIVEQILPFFNPQYTLTIKPFTQEYPEFKEDIPIIIQGLSFQDDFEGAIESRRTIVYTLDFEMKVSFHGPISNSSIIRQVDAVMHQLGVGLNDSSRGLETIRVNVKDSAGIHGMADSDFGFITTIIDSA